VPGDREHLHERARIYVDPTGLADVGRDRIARSFEAAWTEMRRVLDDPRLAMIGPPALLDQGERSLGSSRALAQPLRVLGAMVVIPVLAPSSAFAGSRDPLRRELAEAWERCAT
jgi:hypothetical protein